MFLLKYFPYILRCSRSVTERELKTLTQDITNLSNDVSVFIAVDNFLNNLLLCIGPASASENIKSCRY